MKKTFERAEIFAQKKAITLKENFSNYKEDQECDVIHPYIKERLIFFESQATQNKDIPLDLLPGIFGKFAKEYAKVYQAPNNYVFGSMIISLSTVIGMSVVLHTTKYKNSACIYGMIIGRSGSTKSHPLEYFLNPIVEIDSELYKKKLSDEKQWRRNEKIGIKPVRENLVITSGTSEGILKRLETSPKGFINYVDEIESFFKSRDVNSSAITDLIDIWNNKVTNRILKDSDNDYEVPLPFMNLFGTIQVPELINRWKQIGTSNGLLWRFFPIINTQREIPYENDLEVNLKLKTSYDHEMKAIHYSLYRDTMQIDQEIEKLICNPKRLLLDVESNIIYNDYTRYCTYRQRKTPNGQIVEILSKVKIYCLRFALIFHVAKRGTDFKKYPEIEEDTMWRAVQLSEHLFAAQKYCLDIIIGEDKNIFGVSKKYLDFYKALPNEPFKTSYGNEMAKRYNISNSMVFEFYKNDNFFKKVGHGSYLKTNFS